MAWLKIDDNAPHHRKMLAAGPSACWLWVCGIAYCQKHKTDGFIPAEALPWLGVPQPQKLSGQLSVAGLWHVEDGGWRVHDYLDWNDSAVKRREKIEQKNARQQKWRDGKGRYSDAEVSRDDDAQARRDVDASTSGSVDTAPQPTPQPTPQPQPTPPPTTTSVVRVAVGAPGLVTSPADYDRLKRTHRHVGARLRVPNVLHAELTAKLGGENPDAALLTWYAELDAALEASREPVPDVFTWLRPRFVEWARAQAGDVEMAKFLAGSV